MPTVTTARLAPEEQKPPHDAASWFTKCFSEPLCETLQRLDVIYLNVRVIVTAAVISQAILHPAAVSLVTLTSINTTVQHNG